MRFTNAPLPEIARHRVDASLIVAAVAYEERTVGGSHGWMRGLNRVVPLWDAHGDHLLRAHLVRHEMCVKVRRIERQHGGPGVYPANEGLVIRLLLDRGGEET